MINTHTRQLKALEFELLINKMKPSFEMPIIENCHVGDIFIFKNIPKLDYKHKRFATGLKPILIVHKVKVPVIKIVDVYRFGLRAEKAVYTIDLNVLELTAEEIKLN